MQATFVILGCTQTTLSQKRRPGDRARDRQQGQTEPGTEPELQMDRTKEQAGRMEIHLPPVFQASLGYKALCLNHGLVILCWHSRDIS